MRQNSSAALKQRGSRVAARVRIFVRWMALLFIYKTPRKSTQLPSLAVTQRLRAKMSSRFRGLMCRVLLHKRGNPRKYARRIIFNSKGTVRATLLHLLAPPFGAVEKYDIRMMLPQPAHRPGAAYLSRRRTGAALLLFQQLQARSSQAQR